MAECLILKNVLSVEHGRRISVRIDNGIIERITADELTSFSARCIDCDGYKLIPGFIDIHNHGAMGIDVNEADVDGLLKISQFLSSKGVTGWLPTIVPDDSSRYAKIIDAIEQAMKLQNNRSGAQILGVHYEGVFANQQMCGALRPQFFRVFTGNELEDLPTLRSGIHLMTLAPEIQGGVELIQELHKRNWIICIGHTRAGVETLEMAFQNGARHLTHFFNAMTGIHHREIGVAGWGLIKDEISFDIIADKIHVRPEILKFACRVKSPDKVALISDSVAPTGLGEGEFQLWGERISVKENRTQNERGSIAGSVITMMDAFKNMVSLGFSEREVCKMASLNPAKLLRIESLYGSIQEGKRADLVVLSEDYRPIYTIMGGRIVFEA